MLQVSNSLSLAPATVVVAPSSGAAAGAFSSALAAAAVADIGPLSDPVMTALELPLRQNDAETGKFLPDAASFLPGGLTLIRDDRSLPAAVDAPLLAETNFPVGDGRTHLDIDGGNRATVAATPTAAALNEASAPLATIGRSPRDAKEAPNVKEAGQIDGAENAGSNRASAAVNPAVAALNPASAPLATMGRSSRDAKEAPQDEAPQDKEAALLNGPDQPIPSATVAISILPAIPVISLPTAAARDEVPVDASLGVNIATASAPGVLENTTISVATAIAAAERLSPLGVRTQAVLALPVFQLPADPRIVLVQSGQRVQASVGAIANRPAIAGPVGQTIASPAPTTLTSEAAFQGPPAAILAPLIGVPQPAAHAFAAGIAAAVARAPRDSDAMPVAAAIGASPPLATGASADVRIDHAPLDMRKDDWSRALLDRIDAVRDIADARDSRIRLIPDALGKIDIALRQHGDTLHVHFTADVAATRSLLADAQPRLAELAEARGLRLGQSAVDGGQGQEPRRQPQPATVSLPTQRRDSAASEDMADSDQRIA